jgi:uncharacterized protein YndB with AHSA1/START domain
VPADPPISPDPLIKDIYIDAPPDLIFSYLTDPAKMIRWMGISAEIDPRPGGIYRLDPNGGDIVLGKYLDVQPNSRIVFTWGFERNAHDLSPGSTTVEIDLTPEGRGTRLRLTHKGLSPDARGKHAYGWGHYLTRLQLISEGRDPGPDPLADPSIRHG